MGNIFIPKRNKSNYESSKRIKDSEEKGKKQYLGSLWMPISITSPFEDAGKKYEKETNLYALLHALIR